MAFKRLREDIDAIMHRDPAARSRLEVLLCYPGLHAVLFYRVSNFLWRKNWPTMARVVSQIAKMLTAVEIHPGATIGRRFFIDHATGVVIGETAEIGHDVTIYHDVTLGGISLNPGKRHPTLEDGVIVGAGAQVLGPITVRTGARVGANAVVISEVPPGATVVGIPARVAKRAPVVQEGDFCSYGISDGLPDPVANKINELNNAVERLTRRLGELEQTYPSAETGGPSGNGKSKNKPAGKSNGEAALEAAAFYQSEERAEDGAPKPA